MSEVIYNNWNVGSHFPYVDSIYNSLDAASRAGLNVVQIMLSSNPFKRTQISLDDITRSNQVLANYPMHVFSHFAFQANLAGKKDKLAWQDDTQQTNATKRIIKVLENELNIVSQLNTLSSGVVIHPGNNIDRENGLKAIATSINQITFSPGSKLLLENSAGQGTSLATTLDEIKTIIDHVHPDQRQYLGVCIDTCHLYAYGDYDISQLDEMKRLWTDFDRIIGAEYLSLVHLNDSKCVQKSCKDRHANIAGGHIWSESVESLLYLLDTCVERRVPLVLETEITDLVTISRLKKLK